MTYLKYLVIFLFVIAAVSGGIFSMMKYKNILPSASSQTSPTPNTVPDNPLSIATMRRGTYPGSDLVIEQTLSPENNYRQYIASYMSEGLKIYGLLTVPNGTKPPNGLLSYLITDIYPRNNIGQPNGMLRMSMRLPETAISSLNPTTGATAAHKVNRKALIIRPPMQLTYSTP
jgi:hypothetical protein